MRIKRREVLLFLITFFLFILFNSILLSQNKRLRKPILIRDDRTKGGDIPKDEVFKLDPKKSKKNVEVGKYYLKHKKYDAAIVRFMDAIKYNPKNHEAKYLLIKSLFKKGNFTEVFQIGNGYLKQDIPKKFKKKIAKFVEKSKKYLKKNGEEKKLDKGKVSIDSIN